MLKHFFAVLTRNWLSLVGASITTVSVVLMMALFAVQSLGFSGGPYLGILTYLILPAFFVLGLLLIPVGHFRQRRRERQAAAHGDAVPRFPVIDLNHERTRGFVLVFLLATVVNVVILAGATYKGVEVMDSTRFCGLTCHTVMQPEYTAYKRSPHSRVSCASCHIGPGADWFVKSKLSGSWQVIAVAFNLYPRPIPTPVHDLRPARETCEQCHWPKKFTGDRLKLKVHYAEDEHNTELRTVLLMKVGGVQDHDSSGIHWHVDPGIKIRYLSDSKRETIYRAELTLRDGTVKTFSAPEAPPKGAVWRTMDCVDCHNRPTHIFHQPGEEVDAALQDGRIDRSLPFIKREGLRAIQVAYPSQAEARQGIAKEVEAFYRRDYPNLAESRASAVQQAGKALGDIYCWNVFPKMKVTWGTYPNHIGHQNSPGCFRCHDSNHKTASGEAIPNDCSLCHSLLAVQQKNPEILQELHP
jgi:NapC/NirT cytochrome c family, N-terminal region